MVEIVDVELKSQGDCNYGVKRLGLNGIGNTLWQEERVDEDNNSDLDNETMTFLVRKFNKFLKRKGGLKMFQRKEAKKSTFKGKTPEGCFTCHECGKLGPMKFKLPTYPKKVENYKNTSRDFKSKKAYIVWDVPKKESTSITSEEEETTKLCLMVNTQDPSTSNDHGESNEVHSYECSSCYENSENSPTYDELYSDFVELHEELKKLARINVGRKRVIILHEKK
ncbi:hypothetical protein Lal_00042927 [Lupinus albus]|nr:hypothetical protein Lal_00042927 [Lupinus albus]